MYAIYRLSNVTLNRKTASMNSIYCFVDLEGLRTGFIELSMLQSVVGKSFRFVMARGFPIWQLLSRNPLMTNQCQSGMLGRLWRMTGYLPLDWCIFTEILNTKGRFWTSLRNSCLSVIKIVLDSMLYETLKWEGSPSGNFFPETL
jgi:hypothetical protein